MAEVVVQIPDGFEPDGLQRIAQGAVDEAIENYYANIGAEKRRSAEKEEAMAALASDEAMSEWLRRHNITGPTVMESVYSNLTASARTALITPWPWPKDVMCRPVYMVGSLGFIAKTHVPGWWAADLLNRYVRLAKLTILTRKEWADLVSTIESRIHQKYSDHWRGSCEIYGRTRLEVCNEYDRREGEWRRPVIIRGRQVRITSWQSEQLSYLDALMERAGRLDKTIQRHKLAA